jgi:hypothetical protein
MREGKYCPNTVKNISFLTATKSYTFTPALINSSERQLIKYLKK